MEVLTCIVTAHNLWLVVMAATVCTAGLWIALTLVRVAAKRDGGQKHAWIFLGGTAGGSAIWCTHFIAEMAYEAGTAVTFEPILTMLSLIVAIGGCTAGFAISQTFRSVPEIGGFVVGASIAAMHYTGMLAFHVEGVIFWSPGYVVASVLISLVFAGLSAGAAGRLRGLVSKTISLALLLVAVVALHFTGMTALTIVPSSSAGAVTDPAVITAMAVAVAGVSMIFVSTGVASYFIDRDTAKENIEKLRFLAMNDALTGLPNRPAFAEYLASELRYVDSNNLKLAVFCIDLNRFKEVNDVHGHRAGDDALKVIGGRLGHLCKPGEFVARNGGDEFSAVKHFADINEVHDFVRRIERRVCESLDLGHVQVSVGLSMGVAIYPEDGDDAERLVGNADMAMYRAKTDVSRTVCFYESEMDERARERRSLGSDLRQALANGECQLFYQVQNSVKTGAISGFEALLRWKHPVRGMIPPSEFIPIAEETGFIAEIGEWVLRTACSEAASWPVPHKIAVNISPIQFMSGSLASLVWSILAETGLEPSRLELEITESTIIADKARTLATLRQIREFGVTIAIDDFGTGYSSLDTLRSFPFDKIKLDRSFMPEVEVNAQARAIVRAVLALGKSLDICVLAEGVETLEQLTMLNHEGCDEAQGFLLGRPMPIEDMEPWQALGVARIKPKPLLRALAG